MSSVDEFVAHWGLDENSIALILKLPPKLLEMVITGFAPKDSTKNVNNLLYGYVKSIATANGLDLDGGAGQAGTSEETQLIVQWCMERGLEDQSCVDALLALTNEQRVEVVSNYAEREGTRNPVGLFLSYVRSLVAGWGNFKGNFKGKGKWEGGKGKSKSSWDFAPQWGAPPAWIGKGAGDGWGQSWGQKGDGYGGQKGELQMQAQLSDADLNGAMQQFILQWGLDEVSQGKLFASNPETQRRVITLFHPKSDVQNMPNKFQSFLKSVALRVELEGYGGDTPQTPAPAKGKGMLAIGMGGKGCGWENGKGKAVAAAPAVGLKRAAQADGKDLYVFTQHWGLDESCLEMLAGQTGDVQKICFETFAPKPDTNNVNGLFIKFLNSIIRAQGGKGKGFEAPYAKGGKYQAQQYEAPAQQYQAPAQQYQAPAQQYQAPPQALAQVQVQAQQQTYADPDSEMMAFIAHWGLDETSLAALASQPAYVKETMYLGFVPKPDTNSVNNLFMSYLKSVATAAANGKGADVLARAQGKGGGL